MSDKKVPALAETEQVESNEKISELEFMEIVDGIYDFVHNPKLRNAQVKMYPNLRLSEYKKIFNLR